MADLTLHNKGLASARKIAQKVWIELLDVTVKELPHPSTEPVVAQSLGADDFLVTAVRFRRTITQPEVDAIRTGTKALFIYGDVEYWDEEDQPHRFEWCSYYMTDKPTAFGLLPSCRFHNSSN